MKYFLNKFQLFSNNQMDKDSFCKIVKKYAKHPKELATLSLVSKEWSELVASKVVIEYNCKMMYDILGKNGYDVLSYPFFKRCRVLNSGIFKNAHQLYLSKIPKNEECVPASNTVNTIHLGSYEWCNQCNTNGHGNEYYEGEFVLKLDNDGFPVPNGQGIWYDVETFEINCGTWENGELISGWAKEYQEDVNNEKFKLISSKQIA